MGERTSRIHAIDIARALAIIGVVFNHTVDGLLGSGLLNENSSIADFNQALYIFRMPALAFVLGLFMPRAAEKRGTHGYIREKVTFAVYIYLIWFIIQMLAEIATSSMKNTPRGWDGLLTVWSMPAHLWFMPFLAVASIVIALAAPWRSATRRIGALSTLGIVSIISWGWNPDIFGLRGLSLLVFTAAGAALGSKRLGTALSSNPISWACFGIASLCGFVLLQMRGITPGTQDDSGSYDLTESIQSLTAAASGIVMLLSAAVMLSHVPGLRGGLREIGSKTLEIYLAHVIIVAGTRIASQKIGMDSEVTVLSIAMVLGIGVPLLMSVLAPRLRMSWLFQTPGALGDWSRSFNLSSRDQPQSGGTSEDTVGRRQR